MHADDTTLSLSPRAGGQRDSVATQAVDEPEPAPPTLRRGEMLGRYLILREIGRGGMGIVFAAYDPELDRKVALKLLHPDRRARDGRAGQARLLREAQALARLSHPNVIQVYDAGAVRDRVFMAMELVRGETLDEWLGREERSWRQVLVVFQAAGQGLAAAHAVGLVHRDFKPANVLLGEEGRVRVLDFGIARPMADAVFEESGDLAEPASGSVLSTPLTRAGVVLGTPRYMAPEIMCGGAFDHRADQFSFCVSLFESLYGEPPFQGEDLRDLLPAAAAGRVREPHGARVPSWIRRILLRGLHADPERRYPSMAALLADLGRDRGVLLRRRAAAAAVFTTLAASGFALYTLQRGEARLCSGTAEKLAGIWDADRKETIQRAFLASGRPYAADAWAEVERSLDAYTTAWAAMRTEVCESTRQGEQSPELLDLRMGCLDRRLREVQAMTTLFAAGDPAVIERAPQASRGLTSLAECADPAALAAPVRPPAGEAARRTLDGLNSRRTSAPPT